MGMLAFGFPQKCCFINKNTTEISHYVYHSKLDILKMNRFYGFSVFYAD